MDTGVEAGTAYAGKFDFLNPAAGETVIQVGVGGCILGVRCNNETVGYEIDIVQNALSFRDKVLPDGTNPLFFAPSRRSITYRLLPMSAPSS